jgi:hypothetical protein
MIPKLVSRNGRKKRLKLYGVNMNLFLNFIYKCFFNSSAILFAKIGGTALPICIPRHLKQTK